MGNMSSLFEKGTGAAMLSGKFAATALMMVALGATTATAQSAKKKPAAKNAAQQSAWVKLCETAKLQKPITKKGEKPKIISKKICITHHERVDGNSGFVVVSAAIRKVEGSDKERLLIMVPLGMALPAGVQAKIDDQKEPIKLKFSLCHRGGCNAETVATKDIISKMKKGKRMIVAAVNATGRPFYAPVPLTGFAKTYAGKPTDSKLYAQGRRQLMMEIRKRQIARARAIQKTQGLINQQVKPKKK